MHGILPQNPSTLVAGVGGLSSPKSRDCAGQFHGHKRRSLDLDGGLFEHVGFTERVVGEFPCYGDSIGYIYIYMYDQHHDICVCNGGYAHKINMENILISHGIWDVDVATHTNG